MTQPTIADLLKYADLQMAAEAFLTERDENGVLVTLKGAKLIAALELGNKHASKFTTTQAKHFETYWEVVAQTETTTGFSGTVFKCRDDDPLTGAKKGEVVMSFRSTEFIDDYARDNIAINTLEIAETGFAWRQLRDMEAWYAELQRDGKLVPGQFGVATSQRAANDVRVLYAA